MALAVRSGGAAEGRVAAPRWMAAGAHGAQPIARGATRRTPLEYGTRVRGAGPARARRCAARLRQPVPGARRHARGDDQPALPLLLGGRHPRRPGRRSDRPAVGRGGRAAPASVDLLRLGPEGRDGGPTLIHAPRPMGLTGLATSRGAGTRCGRRGRRARRAPQASARRRQAASPRARASAPASGRWPRQALPPAGWRPRPRR